MGHLGCADDPAHRSNAAGRDRFAWGVRAAQAAGLRPVQRHLAATSATLTDPLSHHTMSRIGAGLVGIDPLGSTALRPALTLTAPLVSVRRVRAGAPVGYGHTWSTLDGLFDFDAKYAGTADFRIPAELTDTELKELETAAVAMYDALGCAGVARIDFFLVDGRPALNEVNTMPGFTEQSQVPKMFAASGMSYAALLDLLVRDVLLT